jgi:O-acetylhomoserine/O-acetylserine sulfhydrylase-like pyridoxal-dependent enzyme
MALKVVLLNAPSAVASSIIGGADIHIFVFTDHKNNRFLRACSYDPAYRDVSLTDDLAAYLFSYKILHRVHMRKRAGPLAEPLA